MTLDIDDFEREPASAVMLATRRYPRITWTDRAGFHEAIVDERMILGASASADLVVEDATVSRIHVELEPRDGGLLVRDLASSNGTLVDEAPVGEALVREDALLRVGTTLIRIDYSTAVSGRVELWREPRFHGMLGRSRVMRELFALIAKVAPTDGSILINGETGTGKEVAARAIHQASPRRRGPFVVVDCAALAEHLLDAELFGHTKGAFTGAVQARVGAIEAAHGGTVFLDEIGELPMAMQPKLLRVLEQKTVRRVGETSHQRVDVRFVTATHRDLLSMVSRGAFREDLYFRLGVLPIRLPALRERRDDIPLLVEHFLRGQRSSAEFLESLTRRPWRGNVRELRNFVERAQMLGESFMGHGSSAFGEDEAPTGTPRTRPTMMPSGRGPEHAREAAPESRGHVETMPPSSMASPRVPQFSGSYAPAPSMSAPWPSPRAQGSSSAPASVALEGDFKTFRENWIDYGEREYLRRLLERHVKNVGAVAREAGVTRTYIYRLMRKHGLR